MGGQDGCDRRIEVFVKIQKKNKMGGGEVRGVGLGGQGGCERSIEVFCENLKKKKFFFFFLGGGSGGSGLAVRVDVNEELKFL